MWANHAGMSTHGGTRAHTETAHPQAEAHAIAAHRTAVVPGAQNEGEASEEGTTGIRHGSVKNDNVNENRI